MTRNLAIVFFEVVGYAEATTRWTREEAERMVALHRALLLPAIGAFGGKLVKVSGGSYLARFDSPTNAALCAAALHDRTAEAKRVAPATDVEFRVGSAMGEVRLENDDVFGDAVNIAARVVALAEPGEILLAEVVYLAMNKAEVPSEEVGERELKGVPEKVRVYRVPRGVYRLASVSPGSGRIEGLPYGGLGLSHAPNLSPVDPAHPASGSRLVPSAGALAQGVRAALDWARIPSLGSALTPRQRKITAAAAVLLGLGALAASVVPRLIASVTGDPIEQAIDRGDLVAAKTAIDALPKGGHRSYLEGRLVEGSQPARSVSRYVDAARDGEPAARRRLVTLLGNAQCDAKEGAARALGALRETSARAALKVLAETGSDQGLRIGSFISIGCNPASAAKAALAELDALDGG